jgi:hypothetical protein
MIGLRRCGDIIIQLRNIIIIHVIQLFVKQTPLFVPDLKLYMTANNVYIIGTEHSKQLLHNCQQDTIRWLNDHDHQLRPHKHTTIIIVVIWLARQQLLIKIVFGTKPPIFAVASLI